MSKENSKIMDLVDLAEICPNLSVTIKVSDLMTFATEVANQVISSLDRASKEETVWLSPEQVSQRIGVDKSTLWRWNKTGYLPGTKFGRKLRYRESDLERIESSEKKGG